MIESLEIKDFGPIKHIHVEDIKPMTVLIGESGSGEEHNHESACSFTLAV